MPKKCGIMKLFDILYILSKIANIQNITKTHKKRKKMERTTRKQTEQTKNTSNININQYPFKWARSAQLLISLLLHLGAIAPAHKSIILTLILFFPFLPGDNSPNHPKLKLFVCEKGSLWIPYNPFICVLYFCVYYWQNYIKYNNIPSAEVLTARIWTEFDLLCHWAQPNIITNSLVISIPFFSRNRA